MSRELWRSGRRSDLQHAPMRDRITGKKRWREKNKKSVSASKEGECVSEPTPSDRVEWCETMKRMVENQNYATRKEKKSGEW